MEYVIGSLLTLLVMLSTYGFFSASLNRLKRYDIAYTQSYNYSLIQPWAKFTIAKKPPRGQSYDYAEKHALRIATTPDNKAYWIDNGFLVVSDVVDGKIDGESKKRVDTIHMDSVELESVKLIVEKLTEGRSNENPDSGNKGI
jgi:hypothetical protein